MMKLFYLPGNTCAIAPHIVLNEIETPVELIKVTFNGEKRTYQNGNYFDINPLGYVPSLQIDSGKILTESSAMIIYLADLKPQAKLIPNFGTWERTMFHQWIAFIATEIHKGYSILYYDQVPDGPRQSGKKRLESRFAHVDKHLSQNKYIMGDTFTAADAYLVNLLSWTPEVDIQLSQWSHLSSYYKQLEARPSIKKAFELQSPDTQ